jgi:peptide deformylase
LALRFIRKFDDPILHAPVPEVKHFTPVLGRLFDDLWESLAHYEGVGLAAPQVGLTKRMVVIDTGNPGERVELVNPRIVSLGEEQVTTREGCLSYPDVVAEVPRAWTAEVEAFDRNGQTVMVKGEGLFARALQHELDHLDGIVFVDRASRIVPPEELASEAEDSEDDDDPEEE